MDKIITNGIPWFDQNQEIVNAHGACLLKKEDKYYLFGEYKTEEKIVLMVFLVTLLLICLIGLLKKWLYQFKKMDFWEKNVLENGQR